MYSFKVSELFFFFVVGKKFMRSINSLKSRPAFHMTLLPSRHLVEPTTADQYQPPKKKRTFYDHRANSTSIITEAEEDPDISDDNMIWDDDSSSNNSFTKSFPQPAKPNNTIRSILNNRRHSQANTKTTTSKGIKDLFNPKQSPFPKKKRESLSNLFSSNKNKQVR